MMQLDLYLKALLDKPKSIRIFYFSLAVSLSKCIGEFEKSNEIIN